MGAVNSKEDDLKVHKEGTMSTFLDCSPVLQGNSGGCLDCSSVCQVNSSNKGKTMFILQKVSESQERADSSETSSVSKIASSCIQGKQSSPSSGSWHSVDQVDLVALLAQRNANALVETPRTFQDGWNRAQQERLKWAVREISHRWRIRAPGSCAMQVLMEANATEDRKAMTTEYDQRQDFA